MRPPGSHLGGRFLTSWVVKSMLGGERYLHEFFLRTSVLMIAPVDACSGLIGVATSCLLVDSH